MLRNNVLMLTSLLLAGTAAGTTIVVAPAGPLTIQAAIDQAAPGDVVELLDGTYRGDGNRDLELRGKAITVRSRSGDAAACVIACEGEPARPHRGFLLRGAELLDTVIEGLTVTGGYGEWGGGIYCLGGFPTIRNCRFVGNTAAGEGGGLATSGPSRVVDCWFSENTSHYGGGGADASLTWGALARFERCTFVRNVAGSYGGGFRS